MKYFWIMLIGHTYIFLNKYNMYNAYININEVLFTLCNKIWKQ